MKDEEIDNREYHFILATEVTHLNQANQALRQITPGILLERSIVPADELASIIAKICEWRDRYYEAINHE